MSIKNLRTTYVVPRERRKSTEMLFLIYRSSVSFISSIKAGKLDICWSRTPDPPPPKNPLKKLFLLPINLQRVVRLFEIVVNIPKSAYSKQIHLKVKSSNAQRKSKRQSKSIHPKMLH